MSNTFKDPAPSETQLTLQIEEILYAFSNYWREGAHDQMPPGDYLTPSQARNALTALFKQALTSLKSEMENKKKTEDPTMAFVDRDGSVRTIIDIHNSAISECQKLLEDKLNNNAHSVEEKI